MPTCPLWNTAPETLARPPFAGKDAVEVVIVGAGMAGLSLAYRLAQEGRRPVVIDAAGVAAGETGRSSAHLSCLPDAGLAAVEALYGQEACRTLVGGQMAAIRRIGEIVAAEGIACGFRRVPGYLTGEDEETLEREFAAAQAADLLPEWTREIPFLRPAGGRAILYREQAQMDPVAYAAGLARAAERHGARIYGGTVVEAVENGAPAIVRLAGGGTLLADHVVAATGAPFLDWVAMHSKQTAMRTYVIGYEAPGAPSALLWDTEDPLHYIRRAGDFVLVGGEDHPTGREPEGDPLARLAAWAEERLGMTGTPRVRWSGQILEPIDRMPFIGRNPGGADNVYVVTGTSGNGLTYGEMAAGLLAGMIGGEEGPEALLLTPRRLVVAAAGRYAAAQAEVAAQYVEWLRGGEVGSAEEIPPGEGAVIREGLGKVAVHRRADGEVCAASARCPHLGCVVDWNRVEKTWDCPCHGSRFRATGEVISGPATAPLERVEISAGPAGVLSSTS